MSKTISNPFLQFVAYFISCAIAGMIIWPLFDWIICLVFTHSDFSYSVNEYIVQPILFAVVIAIVFTVFDVVGKKKKTKK